MKETLIFFFISFYNLIIFVFNKGILENDFFVQNNTKIINNIIRKLSTKNDNNKLNNIIKIFHPNDRVNYISSISNTNGDLFLLTNIEGGYKNRIIYAIKSNGEKYFENEDQYYKMFILLEEGNNKYPLLTFVKINDIEYLVTFSQDGPIELFNFQDLNVYSTFNLRTVKTNSVVRKNTFFSFSNFNNFDYALNAFIDKKNPYKLWVQKIYFQNYKLDQSTTLLVNNTNSDLGNRNSSVTCFEINNYIECLYENSRRYYTVSVYEISNLELVYNKTVETNPTTYEYLFNKCIYIKDYIGGFIYFLDNDNSPIFSIKELIIPSITSSKFQLNDYFPPIKINKENIFFLGSNYIYNDIIKTDEKNIFYISTDNESEKLMIIIIKILNNYQNLLICYYEIKLQELYSIKIYTDITSFVYNGCFGIGMTHYDYNIDNNKTYSSFFIIGNSSINKINITDDIDIFDEENIYNLEIENIINIDNNIFGYIPIGIKILSELNEKVLNFSLYSKNLQKDIQSNEIILINDTINFKRYNNSGIKLGTYTFELLHIISEPDFDDFISDFKW